MQYDICYIVLSYVVHPLSMTILGKVSFWESLDMNCMMSKLLQRYQSQVYVSLNKSDQLSCLFGMTNSEHGLLIFLNVSVDYIIMI